MELTVIVTLIFSLFHFCGELLTINYLSDFFLILNTELFLVAILISAFVNGSALFLLCFKTFSIAGKTKYFQTQNEDPIYLHKFNGAKESTFAVFCGTFLILMALMNSIQCAFSAHMAFQFSNENTILYLKDGIQCLEKFYGKRELITKAFDRIQENNKCCGLNNAIYEYRRSNWFRAQRRSPRRYFPPSCNFVERELNFIAIKTHSNQAIKQMNNSHQDIFKTFWRHNSTMRIQNKVNEQKGKTHGCFDPVRHQIIAIGIGISMSAFASAIAQLAHAFYLLFKSLQLNKSDNSKAKLLNDNATTVEESI